MQAPTLAAGSIIEVRGVPRKARRRGEMRREEDLTCHNRVGIDVAKGPKATTGWLLEEPPPARTLRRAFSSNSCRLGCPPPAVLQIGRAHV